MSTFLVVMIPATLGMLNLRAVAGPSSQAVIHSGDFEFRVPRENIPFFAVGVTLQSTSHTVCAMNMPGFAGEGLLAIVTTKPSVWRPKQLTLDAWRSICYSLFCLPAWWFFGKGVEALVWPVRMRWPALLLGSVLEILCIVLLLGLRFGVPTADRSDPNDYWIFWGFGLWSFFFSVFPFIWIRQIREAKRIK